MDNNYHMCTKHIDIWFHYICQTVEEGAINLIYCPTDNMTADILTKVLPGWKVVTHALRLGLHCASGGVLESSTPKVPKVKADRARGSTGGYIVRSTITGQPVASGSAAHTSVCIG